MKFADIWLLNFIWLAPVVFLLLIYASREKQKALQKFAHRIALQSISGVPVTRASIIKNIFITLSIVFIAIALAGPRWGSHYQEVSQKGVDIMVAVDVSLSMAAEDIKPDRMERARREILDLLKAARGDRIGLVAFSGSAFLQCPLTLDYAAVEMFLSQLEPGLIPVQGTDIGSAIETAIASFDDRFQTDKVILLITDGEDNEGKGLDAAKEAAAKGVKIFVFGMGNSEGAPVPLPDGGFAKDGRGNLVLSKLDESSLKKIADATGGEYIRSSTGDLDLDLLYFSGIRLKTRAAELKSGKIKVYEERFVFFIIAAFILLLWEVWIRERKKPVP